MPDPIPPTLRDEAEYLIAKAGCEWYAGGVSKQCAAAQLTALLAWMDERGLVVMPRVATEGMRACMATLNHPRDAELYAAAIAAYPSPLKPPTPEEPR